MFRTTILSIIMAFSACGALAKNPVTVIHGDDGEKFYTGLIPQNESLKGYGQEFVTLEDCGDLPENFDLRELGVVGPIKDQGSCGSCWAFSKTASLESAAGGNLDLSEQELVSCDRNNYGCNGGLLNRNEYQVTKGQSGEESFPYTARGTRCKSGLEPIAQASKFVYIGEPDRSPTQKELQCAIYKSKTIPWITVGANAGWTYVPNDPDFVMEDCSPSRVNHAVGVVGWRTIKGKVSFIMRNSWGEKWGAGGYLNMPLGCDSLGEEAAYVVGALKCPPPKAELPVEVLAKAGTTGSLNVEAEDGVEYRWYLGTRLVAQGPEMKFSPTKDGTIRLVAKNKCGKTTVRTKLKVSR